MIIGVIGSGGREHSICSKILESKKVSKVYCFPGNAGTNLVATNVKIKVDAFDKLTEFVINYKIALNNLYKTVDLMCDHFFDVLLRILFVLFPLQAI